MRADMINCRRRSKTALLQGRFFWITPEAVDDGYMKCRIDRYGR